MSKPERWLTVREVADRLGLRKADAILKLIHAGALVAANVSSGPGRPTWRIAPADLASFLAGRRPSAPLPTRRTRRPVKDATRYF